jgi:FkbM family methyltransferase
MGLGVVSRPRITSPDDIGPYRASIKEVWDAYPEIVPDVVVDIGAHVGLFSLDMACNGAKFVIAVEADLDNYMYLLENVQENNKLGRVFPVLAAVSDKSFNFLSIYSSQGNSGMKSLKYKSSAPSRPVSSIALEDVLTPVHNRFGKTDFLKIDIEGAEWATLSERERLSSELRKVEYIDVEYHELTNSLYYEPEEHQLSNLVDYFTSLGFSITTRSLHENGVGHIYGYNLPLKAQRDGT